MIWPVAVVGGGAAGIMAAIQAAEQGCRVLVLERNQRLGKKILASGNGRCNLTNADASCETYHGTNPRFAASALAQVDVPRTRAFFEELGLVLAQEAGGRVFPSTQQASSVLELLEYRLSRLDVRVVTEARMQGLTPVDGRFRVDLVGGASHHADRVIVAVGSSAHPQLGTTGDGYRILGQLGYTVVEPYPSLVPLHSPSPAVRRLQGLRLQVEATARVGHRRVASRSGEILFTPYGISGPVVLWLSGLVADRVFRRESVALELNLLPGMTREELDELLRERWAKDPARPLGFSFVGLLPAKLARELVPMVETSPELPVGSVASRQRGELARLITTFEIPISTLGSMEQAEVAGGGVSTDHFSSKTMESRLHAGLYVVGELLDIHGDWGGFNLQFAWSSGWVAGAHASRAVTRRVK